MTVQVKICGLGTPEAVAAAVEAGAAWVGFVLFPNSPRNVSVAAAAELARHVPPHVETVAVTVDADDALLAAIAAELAPAFVQAHGRESPERVAAMRAASGARIIKAIPVAEPGDLASMAPYGEVADMLLFDARPPADAARPGGHGLGFDWSLLAGLSPGLPWLLSGGLTPENVAEAIATSGARAVDVSSGVESAPGVKDVRRIRAFLEAARAVDAREPA